MACEGQKQQVLQSVRILQMNFEGIIKLLLEHKQKALTVTVVKDPSGLSELFRVFKGTRDPNYMVLKNGI